MESGLSGEEEWLCLCLKHHAFFKKKKKIPNNKRSRERNINHLLLEILSASATRQPTIMNVADECTNRQKVPLEPGCNQLLAHTSPPHRFWRIAEILARLLAAVHSDFILLLTWETPFNLTSQYADVHTSGLPAVRAKVPAVGDGQEVVAGCSSSLQWGRWGSVICSPVIPEMVGRTQRWQHPAGGSGRQGLGELFPPSLTNTEWHVSTCWGTFPALATHTHTHTNKVFFHIKELKSETEIHPSAPKAVKGRLFRRWGNASSSCSPLSALPFSFCSHHLCSSHSTPSHLSHYLTGECICSTSVIYISKRCLSSHLQMGQSCGSSEAGLDSSLGCVFHIMHLASFSLHFLLLLH